MKELRRHYDIIVLDCPPVLGLSDAQVMTRYSDANVVVVSSNETPIELLEKTKKALSINN